MFIFVEFYCSSRASSHRTRSSWESFLFQLQRGKSRKEKLSGMFKTQIKGIRNTFIPRNCTTIGQFELLRSMSESLISVYVNSIINLFYILLLMIARIHTVTNPKVKFSIINWYFGLFWGIFWWNFASHLVVHNSTFAEDSFQAVKVSWWSKSESTNLFKSYKKKHVLFIKSPFS